MPSPPRANSPVCCQFRACLHGSGGPQVGEVTRLGGVKRLPINSLVLIWSSLHDLRGDHTRDYMDRRVTSPKRVTLPTWVPPPPCKQTLKWSIAPMAGASRASNGPPSRDYSNISPRLKPFIQILTRPKYAYDRSFTHHQNTVLFFFNVSNKSKLCRVSY